MCVSVLRFMATGVRRVLGDTVAAATGTGDMVAADTRTRDMAAAAARTEDENESI